MKKELGVHGIGSPLIIDSSGPCFGIGGSPSKKLNISGEAIEAIMEKVMERWNGKCPECVSAEIRSKVRRPEVIFSHDVYHIPNKFYDEDGKWHDHDRHKSEQYKCDNGHAFHVTTNTKCWCGYGHNGVMVRSNTTLHITTDGNVGIGCSGASKELHIVGDVCSA